MVLNVSLDKSMCFAPMLLSVKQQNECTCLYMSVQHVYNCVLDVYLGCSGTTWCLRVGQGAPIPDLAGLLLKHPYSPGPGLPQSDPDGTNHPWCHRPCSLKRYLSFLCFFWHMKSKLPNYSYLWNFFWSFKLFVVRKVHEYTIRTSSVSISAKIFPCKGK